MTWAVLPQGFRDSPHLFGQAVSWDLLDLDLGPNGKILQYIDDLLICSPDEKSAQQHAIQVLNFLAEKGYKVSRAKAQMVETKSLTWEFRLHTGPGGCPLIGALLFHSCLETLDHWTKPREGLSEDPLTNPEEIWYTDGSSFVLDGKRRAGYAVVSNFETIEAKPLPPAVKVPGHDSWIHYSQVKPWKKTEEDTQYTCQPATTCSASSTKI
ncbi:uncharacterized protein LOC129643085 isoform X5 [Bubalus kerabau]|uniref:uncharacterized protein LOC129643085 isoform X5 n=1 Tax=Bubalus carabanensis TaxID=3119969 RepID=UPI00244EFE9C|nr:uncharacterized protein LOC129643085 isoform X5 [Bubalus carabanensis]